MGVLVFVVAVKWLTLLRLARRYAVDILYQDMWMYYAPYFNEQGPFQAFLRQHGPHRMGIGLVYEGIVMKSTGWNVRTLAHSVTLVLLAATVCHLVALRRQTKSLTIADAIVPVWLMSERLGEHVVVWPSTSHSFFALFFLSVIALAFTVDRAIVRWGATCLIVPLAIFTGFGVIAGPVLLAVLVLEAIGSRWRGVHTVSCAVLIGTYVAFLWNFDWSFTQRLSGDRFTSTRSWSSTLLFGSYMMASAAGIRRGGVLAVIAGGLGVALFVGVVVWVFVQAVRVKRRSTTTLVALLLCLYTLAYVGGASVGRQRWFGPEAAFQPRYIAGVVPGVLALWWLVREKAERSWAPRKRMLLLGLTAIALAVPALTVPEKNLFHRTCVQKRAWMREFLETGNIDSADEASMGGVLVDTPDRRDANRHILEKRIEYLRERRLSLFRDRGGADPVNEATC